MKKKKKYVHKKQLSLNVEKRIVKNNYEDFITHAGVCFRTDSLQGMSKFNL